MRYFLIITFLTFISCENKVDFKIDKTSQNFAQDVKYNKTVDILFVIDNSSSMKLVQDELNRQVPYLVDSLVNLNMDFHVGFTSTTMIKNLSTGFEDQGRLIGSPRFLTPQSPDFLNEMKKRIALGEDGSTIEEGLASMEAVLSDDYLSTEGAGFLRPDSFLNIIILSNEDDSSSHSWDYFAKFLDKLRPNKSDGLKSWSLHYFGVLSDQDACSSSEWDYRYPGYKYMNLVDYSGGQKASLCSQDLYKSVSNIKARIIQILTDYKLDKIPNISTLKVYVDEKEVPNNEKNGWSYLATENLIRFNGTSVPSADSKIRVDFTPKESN